MSDLDYWEKQAPLYDRAMRFVSRPLSRAIDLTVGAVKGSERVLEVAAGTGLITVAIAKVSKDVIATDYAGAMVNLLQRRVQQTGLSNVRCERADLYALRFNAGSFDAVIAANVLHLVPDLAAALAALRHVLRPGGRLVVPTFCHDETILSAIVSRVISLTGFPAHRRFTARSLRQALESAGLRVQHAETLPGIIPIGYADGVFVDDDQLSTDR
ncbi:MAG: class I SAM-dependent methyltransferase [Steroidobacteraceae bacterium]